MTAGTWHTFWHACAAVARGSLFGWLAVAFLGPAAAGARPVRPLFEPTDLEMEEAGVTEVDLQLGAVRGPTGNPWRAVLPDFELDLGLLPNLELDLDGAYAIEGPDVGPFSFDHAAPDSLFPSLKIGLFDRDLPRGGERSPGPAAGRHAALAGGVQLGPKLPVASKAHGVGIEGLALVGLATHTLHLALNLGGFVDPAPDATSGRPKGLEAGLDLELGLGGGDLLSLTGELSAVHFLSSDPEQLLATLGLTWSVTQTLDLSIVGLVGFMSGSDRHGILLGISPKWRLFGTPPPPSPSDT
jgi:hypothetical protein